MAARRRDSNDCARRATLLADARLPDARNKVDRVERRDEAIGRRYANVDGCVRLGGPILDQAFAYSPGQALCYYQWSVTARL